MKEIKHIIGYEILQGKILNAILFPLAYVRRDKLKEGDYLYGYLHEGNLYGDADFKPEMKDGLVKAWLWAMRNPLHNRYYENEEKLKETNHKGFATGKYKVSPGSWRTYRTETGSRNGKIIDWEGSLFGEQDITFDMVFPDRLEKGQRKSSCIPKKILNRIVIHSKRYGHERGLLQSSFNYAFFSGKENLEGYKKWKEKEWVKVNL